MMTWTCLMLRAWGSCSFTSPQCPRLGQWPVKDAYELETAFLRSDGTTVAGVIPIDRLTDVRAPAEVIAQRIPRPVLEATYGMQLPRPRNGAHM